MSHSTLAALPDMHSRIFHSCRPAYVGKGPAARTRTRATPGESAVSARHVLQTCLQHFASRRLQDVIPYLPSSEVARGSMQQVSKHQANNPVLFEAVIEGMLLQNPADHFLDSYALRNLVVSPPASCQELSAVSVGDSMWVCRQTVQADTGEEAVLTFTLTRNQHSPAGDVPSAALTPGSSWGRVPRSDTSVSAALPQLPQAATAEPSRVDAARMSQEQQQEQQGQQAQQGQGLSDPELHVGSEASGTHAPPGVAASSSSEVVVQQAAQPGPASNEQPARRVMLPPPWRLARVRGEPRHALLPRTPSPEFSPESVVQAQLAALQQYDFAQAYALLSPAAQALVGPLDRYITSMGRSRLYRSLVAHRSATSLRRCQHSAGTYLEVVAVEGQRMRDERNRLQPGGMSLYCWIVTKQEEQGPLKDCWVTEWVKVVDDPKLRHVLGLGLPHSEEET